MKDNIHIEVNNNVLVWARESLAISRNKASEKAGISSKRIAQLEEFGAFGYVRKPFQPEQLRDVLEPLLGVKNNDAAEQSDTQNDLF